ncbi:MAG: N-acetylmuramoyl-L-alanine amidase [Clostridia bacterium]|nr:N-acetylmuramoyl-L-alanine amidase [Clostridia bacterium]
MGVFMLKGRIRPHTLVPILVLLLSLLLSGGVRSLAALAALPPSPLVILDAGHGGIDAGAVGAAGSKEKELVLAYALTLKEMFTEAGVPVLLTRTEDALVLGGEDEGQRGRKAKDLKNRAAIAARYPGAVFVSLHMNAYPVAKYRGFEVYYGAGEGSRPLAERITARVKKEVDPVYTRTPRAAGEGIYLLSHMTNTAVLVEFGFLSCPEEEAKLLEKDYQKKLCFCVFYAIMEEKNLF